MPYESFIATRTAIDAPITPTLEDLRRRRRPILRLATLANLEGVCVAGSVARGDATADSDIDLIVDPQPGASLLDLAQFVDDLEQLLGRPVDVLSSRTLHPDSGAQLVADGTSCKYVPTRQATARS